jgi:ACGX-repeat protein
MNKLNLLNGWAGIKEYFAAPRSAQGYLNSDRLLLATSGIGASCGTGNDDQKPSACGAGDDQPKPSACGAGDDDNPKPSACGSSCGSDDK